jgi:hypothetical protein
VVKRLIQGIALLIMASVTELAMAQTCPQSTSTINVFLQNFQKSQTSTVVYAWTGAHFVGGVWADRKNPTDIIVSSPTGAKVSQNFSSSFTHGANRDASSASTSAECTNPTCTTASLSTSACVTSKVDSAGSGAYARAGITVPPKSSAAKTGTVMINIPNRMTLTSNVGDESGVWGFTVSVEKVEGHKSLVDKGPLDVAPFLVNLLGLKDEKQFKVHSEKKRFQTFAAGFELNPQGTEIKLIGPDGAGMTAVQQSTAAETLNTLRKRFVISPCPTVGKVSVGKAVMVPVANEPTSEKCHTAEYLLGKGEDISIEVPYEFPYEPEKSTIEQILFIEVGHAGRDVEQTKYVNDEEPASK